MSDVISFPRQMLSFRSKTTEWRKKCVLWADSKTFFNYSLVRKSIIHKKINYDLLEGKLHMEDVQLILNPDGIQANFLPSHLQHYPIMNSKINVLRGEEIKRPFDYRVVVTNPDAVSEVEENKKEQVFNSIRQLIENTSVSEDDYQAKLEKLGDYYNYEWQDLMELRANELLNHYKKEYNIPLIFNKGFVDGMAVGEEIYQVDINGGEPTIEKLNPLKVHVFKSGYSNKIEDADLIILEDYWSPGKIIDTYYDQLTPKDIKYLEEMPDNISEASYDSMGQRDERLGFVNRYMAGFDFGTSAEALFGPGTLGGTAYSLMPYDLAGNVRVLRVYWKSKRKILKVKQYDPETGEEHYEYYSENYVPDKSRGEEAKTLWINEAWEGTMIGGRHETLNGLSGGIFVNMRPRPVQFTRMSNPSKCHFGIIGTIYNLNEDKPFSLVDMMKSYNYLYDMIHYRLNDAIAANWGDILELDLAKIPAGWDVQKWLYFAKINHIGVVDSFKEGDIGVAQGKLAGSLNNNTKGMISSNIGNYIQQMMNLLEWIKMEMGEIAGISKQREGQVSNRETVGGVERATLQSSYITEWLFAVHDDTKKRVLEAFLEAAKIAMRGKKMKFQYITSDISQRIMEIDGDEFAMNDYGLVVDSSSNPNEMLQKLEGAAQAAAQNGSVDISALMKIWSSASLAQKIRIVERSEQRRQEQSERQQQQQLQAQQNIAQMNLQQKQAELEMQQFIATQNNQTKMAIAQLQADNKVDVASLGVMPDDGIQEPMTEADRAKLREQVREFNEKLKLDIRKLDLQESKQADDKKIKLKQVNNKKQ